MPSSLKTYCLWLFAGWLGLHHVYMNRPYHAFTWFVTCGGFGLGLLWDLCEMGNYLDESQSWTTFVQDSKFWRPARCSTIRFVGQLIVGCWLGFMSMAVVPNYWWQHKILTPVSYAIPGVAIAWGVYVVGNIGLQRRKFLPSLSVSVTVCLIVLRYMENVNGIIWAACLSSLTANYGARWRTDETHLSRKIFWFHTFLYCLMWFFIIFNNGQIYYNGKMLPIPEATREFMDGFEWNEFLTHVSLASAFIQSTSYDLIVQDFLLILKNIFLIHTVANPRTIDEAYEILGLNRFTTMKEIRSHCRKLMKQYHPDKFFDSDEQKAAEIQFVKIQRSCHILARDDA